MNVTLSLNDDLVRKVRKLAVERDTTLTGLIRDYLEKLSADEDVFGRKKREREILEQSFEELQFQVGKHDWKRADLYDRD
jgi:predicted transcriptional regulator